jgi:ABC-type bacteriocin/lantibiotic exporter with double-glycine peptidase domain
METLTPVKRFFRMLQLDRKDIVYIYVYAIFAGLITLSLPLGIQAIIGLLTSGTVSTSWALLIAIVTIGTALTGVLKIMQLTVTETIQRRIFARSSFDFAFRIPRLFAEDAMKRHPPEMVNRFFDTLTIQKGLPKILMDFSTSFLEIIFGLLLLSFYHPFFVFFGVTLLFILFIIFRYTGPGGLKTSLKESKHKYEVAYWLEEVARTLTTFKLAGRSDLPMNRTDQEVSHYLDARKNHFRILVQQYGAVVAFKTVVTGGLLMLGSLLVFNNQLNLGQFVAAEIIVLLIMNSVEKLILSMDTIYDVLTGLEKIGNVMDLPFEEQKGVCFEEIDTGKGIEIEVKDLSYQFHDGRRPTLDNVSFSVKPGEKICIAGYNSAGKSTLVHIIAGLYQHFSGSVTYNGFPLRNLDIISLRSHIGDHSSKEDIFRGTLLDNIRLGHEDVSLEDVIATCHELGLTQFIRSLPNGYNTELLPGGKNIPRSVVTKIILARGIVSRPALLAMEEMMTNLEQRDRIRIAEILTSKEKQWTMLAVSDDPILASRCDRTIIMKDGKIVQDGNFAEILNCPHYDNVFKTITRTIPSVKN